MSRVEIINPLPGGMRYTSAERARKFCSLGMATMSIDGRLLFTIGTQGQLLDRMSEEEEIARNPAASSTGTQGQSREPSAGQAVVTLGRQARQCAGLVRCDHE